MDLMNQEARDKVDRAGVIKRVSMLSPMAKEAMLLELVWKAEFSLVSQALLLAMVKDEEKDVLKVAKEMLDESRGKEQDSQG